MTVWLALTGLVMVMLIGIVVDLGGQIHTQQRDQDLAAQAARVGGQQVQAASAVQGQALAINSTMARTAAQRYLTDAGLNGTVTVTGTTITVTIHDAYPTKFLGVIGINTLKVTAHATAQLIRTLGGTKR